MFYKTGLSIIEGGVGGKGGGIQGNFSKQIAL